MPLTHYFSLHMPVDEKPKVILASDLDIPQLNPICLAAKRHWGYPETWIQHWLPDLTLAPDHFQTWRIYKLVLGQQPIGFCSIEEHPTFYEVHDLWLLPTHMGNGWGALLLKETISQVCQNPKPIQLDADPNAMGFYRKMGFKTIGEVESFPKGRFLPVMQRPPNSP